jgi:hypothetical protein
MSYFRDIESKIEIETDEKLIKEIKIIHAIS